MTLFEQSGMKTKAHFITKRIFSEPFKVIKIDKSAADYYSRLTSFYGQFRAIGVNYNQVAKVLNSKLSDRKAMAFIYKLEKLTVELVTLSQQIIDRTNEFEKKHLMKEEKISLK